MAARRHIADTVLHVRDDTLLEAAGPLRSAYEAVDWAATPLGPMASWSGTLRNAVDVALHSRFPITLFWGPEHVLVYNEAYVELIADKHPDALGTPARDVFPEAWDLIGPMMEGVLAGAAATYVVDEPVPLVRRGFLEECYFTFSYSAVRDADGTVEGVIDVAAETTQQVLDRRRLALLSRLGDALADLPSVDELPERALAVLRRNSPDLPLVDVRVGDGSHEPRLPATPPRALDGDDLVVADGVAWLALASAGTSALVVELSPNLAHDEAYFEFLRLIAATLDQTLDRVHRRAAERDISESLQRSLLTSPPDVPGLDLAVHYQPAAEMARIGGDWYDAFPLPDGSLMVVVGDVAGHDRRAAASMGQMRNLLRGVAYTGDGGPATVLERLDRALAHFDDEAVATAIVARIDLAAGRMTVASAGHPPAVVVPHRGSAWLLPFAPDPVLGVDAGSRTDHEVDLPPGTTLVLYTDGLVERRGENLGDALSALAADLTGTAELAATDLCARIVARLEEPGEDDVALLVLRVL